jgi:cyclic dehypoxanthinyl futalosine synthase
MKKNAIENWTNKVLKAPYRISREEAIEGWNDLDESGWIALGTAVRGRFHAPKKATYLIMGIVNYTNVCVAGCDFCSFYRRPGARDAYLYDLDEIRLRLRFNISLGARLVGMNGGFHPDLDLVWYERFFRALSEEFGSELEIHAMTVAEFLYLCRHSRVSLEEGARRLREAGVRWITGGGAEILDDAFRARHSPAKFTVDEYFEAQRVILRGGIGSTATMVIGFGESVVERMNHLERLRAFQDEMIREGHPLPSFLAWRYLPSGNALGGEKLSLQEYLRHLALARVYLDNFKHIRTSVLTGNAEALLGLAYGADDFDLPTEDEVTVSAGASISREFDRILTKARRLGFEAIRREPWKIEEGVS